MKGTVVVILCMMMVSSMLCLDIRKYSINLTYDSGADTLSNSVVVVQGNKIWYIDIDLDVTLPNPIEVDITHTLNCVSVDSLSKIAYITTSNSSILSFNISTRAVRTINIDQGTNIRIYLPTRLRHIKNTNYLVALSHFHNTVLYLDTITEQKVWKDYGLIAIKEMVMSDRYILFMDEPGLYYYQVLISDRSSFEGVDYFSSPGNVMFKMDYYAIFPEKDYFIVAGGGGSFLESIIIFEAVPQSPKILKDLGGFSFNIEFLKYIHNTNYIFVGNSNEGYFLNADSARIDGVVNPNLRLEMRSIFFFHQFEYPFTSQFLLLSTSDNMLRVQDFDSSASDAACAVGCKACDRNADRGSCISCEEAFNFNSSSSTNRCTPNCALPKKYNRKTRTCVVPMWANFRVDSLTLSTFNLNCRSPLDLGKCEECSSGFIAYRSSCINGTSSCPTGSFVPKGTTKKICEECHPNCASCVDKGSSQCTSCVVGLKKTEDKSTFECDSDCGVGYFYSKSSSHSKGSCMPCSRGCDKCYANHELKCLECSAGFYRNGGFCDFFCPSGFEPNPVSKECDLCTDQNCTPCEQGKFVEAGRCLDKCPVGMGTYKSGNLCLKCYDANCRYLSLPNGSFIQASTGRPISRDEIESEIGKDNLTSSIVAWAFAIIGICLFGFCLVVTIRYVQKYKSSPSKNKKKNLEMTNGEFENARKEDVHAEEADLKF